MLFFVQGFQFVDNSTCHILSSVYLLALFGTVMKPLESESVC
jgi:hypothetical protein